MKTVFVSHLKISRKYISSIVTLYFTCKTHIEGHSKVMLRSNGSSTSSINKGRRQSMKSKNGGSHREEQTKTKITVLQEESQKKQP